MSTDLIRYDLLVQNALKGVVHNVLAEAARDGLQGDHHFCITFRTHAPGVKISPRVRQQHPEELTIILQHQFWDLVVTDHAFEVGLSFGRIPERLAVPFDAVTGFWDPSVQFGLKFEVQDEGPQGGANDAAPAEARDPGPSPAASKTEPTTEPTRLEPKPAAPASAVSAESASDTGESASPGSSESKVVSIDAFRKKT